jgi:hypothetical protein
MAQLVEYTLYLRPITITLLLNTFDSDVPLVVTLDITSDIPSDVTSDDISDIVISDFFILDVIIIKT